MRTGLLNFNEIGQCIAELLMTQHIFQIRFRDEIVASFFGNVRKD